MNKAQIDALVAKLRKLVPAPGEWTTLAESACGDAADALELLARQPAAVDKEAVTEAYRKALSAVTHSRTIHEAESYVQRLLANEASKPAAPFEVDQSDPLWPKHLYENMKAAREVYEQNPPPAAPSVEQDERGACEVELEKSVWTRQTEARNAFRDGWDAGRAWQARAASTSANVAQCANCGMAVDPKCGCSLGRAASANVAQGAGAVEFKWPPMPILPHHRFYVFDRVLFTEHQMQAYANAYGEVVRAALSAPPAQTALTDDARDAIEWAAQQASSYARPIDGETLMQKRARSLRALLLPLYATPKSEGWRKDAWQPIETAPKDGTPLILFARAKHATASAPVIGWWIPDLGWIESAFSPNHPVGIVPSHWMPRPEFPRALSQKEPQ